MTVARGFLIHICPKIDCMRDEKWTEKVKSGFPPQPCRAPKNRAFFLHHFFLLSFLFNRLAMCRQMPQQIQQQQQE